MTFSARESTAELSCQQVLLPDGTVYSVQCLEVPGCRAEQVTPQILLERYLRLVRSFTCNLVRPAAAGDGIRFLLAGTSLAFLRFAPPEYLCGEGTEAVQLRTIGGLLVRKGEPGRGEFSFLIGREPGGVRVTMQLCYCRPLLLGDGRPSWLRRLVFSATQGFIHRVISVRFLSQLYLELTGDRARIGVKRVRVKDGRDI